MATETEGMRKMKKPELLAPAGDLDRLKTAIRFGADAVYVGGPMLQLRSDTAGFSMEQLEQAAALAHGAGKKLYVAVNAFVRNGEVALLGDYARRLRDAGADAVIVSDLGALRTIAREAPGLDIHVSTQANCLNWAAALQYYEMGAKRVILGREATLEEIRRLRENTPEELELECFVHGAMCMAYSGRCLLSAYMSGRSANRGDCAQPCRFQYALHTLSDAGEYYPIEEDEGGTTLLSSRDLNAMPFLDELIAAGVSSLKIEGRMKSAYYVATVTNAYRHRLDGTASAEKCLRELDCASHREYTSGFYFGEAKSAPAAGAAYLQDCLFIGMVLEYRDGRCVVEQRNTFRTGDRLEILSPDRVGESFVVEDMRNEAGEAIDIAPVPLMRASVKCPLALSPGDILRRRL